MIDYSPLIEKRKQRFDELEELISAPDLYDDRQRAEELMREHRQMSQLLQEWSELSHCKQQLADNQELISSGDEELAELASLELEDIERNIATLTDAVQYSLLPRDPAEDRDALIEIRAGTGGDEASLFALNLLTLYQRYAEARGWRFEILDASPSSVGGFKDVTARVMGQEVFRFLKHESGVHRVQRVPSTETQGRIHTSTATVAVLPEAEEVDVVIRPEELRIETCRSGGAGGQHVNTTESAVQIFHLPSGLMVRCEKERSQIKNRETGMRILRAKLFELKQREAHESYSEQRRAQIGTGGREEKIRTYNFPQNRITDHRISYTAYNLDLVMTGLIDELITRLQHAEMQNRLHELS